MHPEDIKAAIRKRGVTLASIADELAVSPAAVSHVVAARYRSERVMERIAQVIGRKPSAIWPRWYDGDGRLIDRRRKSPRVSRRRR